MRLNAALLHVAALALAILRGLGELAMLQRWRLQDWMLRHGR